MAPMIVDRIKALTHFSEEEVAILLGTTRMTLHRWRAAKKEIPSQMAAEAAQELRAYASRIQDAISLLDMMS